MPPDRILIADDQSAVCEALRLLLTNDGYKVEVVDSPVKVLEFLAKSDYALLLVDLNYTRGKTKGVSQQS